MLGTSRGSGTGENQDIVYSSLKPRRIKDLKNKTTKKTYRYTNNLLDCPEIYIESKKSIHLYNISAITKLQS